MYKAIDSLVTVNELPALRKKMMSTKAECVCMCVCACVSVRYEEWCGKGLFKAFLVPQILPLVSQQKVEKSSALRMHTFDRGTSDVAPKCASASCR